MTKTTARRSSSKRAKKQRPRRGPSKGEKKKTDTADEQLLSTALAKIARGEEVTPAEDRLVADRLETAMHKARLGRPLSKMEELVMQITEDAYDASKERE